MKTYKERMASVQQKLQRKKTERRVLTATAGALCLCMVIGIAVPYFQNRNNIDHYSDSKYFKVIEAIDRDLPYKTKKGNFLFNGNGYYGDGEFLGGLNVDLMAPGAAQGVPEAGPNEEIFNGNASVEITDHQVAGVWEADIIKRSQTHIFYLKGNTLEIYPIAGENTKLMSTWTLETQNGITYNKVEMYLSADATRINLIAGGYGDVFQKDKKSAFVQLISLDVTDPANVKEANSLFVTGGLVSTRMVEDQMLLVAQYRMASKVNFKDESTFLPQIGTPGNMQSINPNNIQIPEKLSNDQYTLVVMLDSQEMTLIDSGAFMCYSTNLYVSQERIYAQRRIGLVTENVDENISKSTNMSEISCMSYDSEGLKLQGAFAVEGTVKDQYSMDEHDGVFRVVTSILRTKQGYIGAKPTEGTTDAQGNTAPPQNPQTTVVSEVIQSANLTCYKVGTWEQIAQVEQFSPNGETVESVRFDGDYAYVCTAVVVTLTDPVFFFDLSDLNNIIVKDTGTIDGYSSSLIQLSDGFLMGIGFDEMGNLKVEIYEETENGVASVCSFTEFGSFASEYKAYYIDRENNIFGIPAYEDYILLQFDGYKLSELARLPWLGVQNNVRGVVIDNCLYVFSKLFEVESLV